MHTSVFFCIFAADFETSNALYMESVKKYLGVILLLLGVIFLVIYRFALPYNTLLVAGIAFEVVGILAYIFINKKA